MANLRITIPVSRAGCYCPANDRAGLLEVERRSLKCLRSSSKLARGKGLRKTGWLSPGGSLMRVHFREKPWDLYWLVGYTIVVAGFLLVLGVGSLPAILFVLFAPGYVVVAALFPGSKEINWVERLALSFGMSIAIVPLLGLALNFTPFGIRFAPIVVTIALFTVLCGGAAWFRRMRMPSPDRLSATFDVSVPAWRDYSLSDRILTAALVASIVMAASALAYIVASPSSQHRFPEFYILGPSRH